MLALRVGLASVLMLACAAGSYFSLHCLLWCCQRTGSHSYVSLVSHAWGHHAWGPRLRDLTLASIVTLQFGTIVASVNALADIFASVPTSVLSGGGGRDKEILPATSFNLSKSSFIGWNGIV